MFYITAIAFFPALLALAAPAGLALTSLTGGREDGDVEVRTALAPIIGLAALSIAVSLLLHLKAPASAMVPVAIALNVVAAAWLLRHGVRVSWGLLAALILTSFLAYLLLISPLLTAGRFGVLGYNVNNDTVFHSIMPEYLGAHGYNFPPTAKDGFTVAAVDKFVAQGYPDGWHQVLLLAMRLFGRRAFFLLNFTEAFYMALMAPVAYVWLRRALVSGGWALFGGLIATVGYIQLSYLFQGFAPQAAVIPFIYACLFLFYEVLIEGQRRWAGPAALLLQASLAIYSFTILIWLVVFVLILLVYRLWLSGNLFGLKVEAATAALIVLAAAAINPFTLIGTAAAFRMVTGWSAAGSLGNLVSRQVPILPVLGMWPTGDHRGVPPGWLHPAAYLGALFVLVIIVIGLKARPSRPLLWMLAATVTAPAVLLKIGASPYYFAKTLHIAGPAAAIVAAAGLYSIAASGRRGRAVFLACIYIIGLAASNWAAVKFISITPDEQFTELMDINDRFAGAKGLTLFIQTGEDWGKYLLANLKVASPFAMSYQGPTPGVRPALAQAGVNDLDSLKGILGGQYSLIVIAKGQDISLPPPPFESVWAGRFYNVYKGARWPDRRDVLSHRPFETTAVAGGAAYREISPGESVELLLKSRFKSLLVSAYLFPDGARSQLDVTGLDPAVADARNRATVSDLAASPALPVAFTAGRRSVTQLIGWLPSVYAVPLAGDSGTVLRVKNTTSHHLRLDWIEPMRRPHDQAALFRYNNKNKRVFQSTERLISR